MYLDFVGNLKLILYAYRCSQTELSGMTDSLYFDMRII